MIDIRIATSQDLEDIRQVYMSAFPEQESQLVAKLAVDLLSEINTPEILSLVAENEADADVLGHIAFSPVSIDKDKNWQGYILAPLGIKPQYQKNKLGSKLINRGLKQLSQKGVNVVVVYGDPAYYGQFGFKAETAEALLPPYQLQYPFGWQALVLDNEFSHQQPCKISCVASLCHAALW